MRVDGDDDEEDAAEREPPKAATTTTNSSGTDGDSIESGVATAPSAVVVLVDNGDLEAAEVSLISPTGVADLQRQQPQTPDSTDSPSKKGKKEATTTLVTAVDTTPATTTTADTDDKTKNNKSYPPPEQRQRQSSLPHLDLHQELRRDMSQGLVDRVSFYAIIHDINKEASAMASNDELLMQQGGAPHAENDDRSPLVVAAVGGTASPVVDDVDALDATSALLDEEEWLLSTIAARRQKSEGNDDGTSSVGSSPATSEIRRKCPDTFLQAMGEKEYENPVASLAGNTRTQLWKPSRSWWEAKSGKNPWIEPSSHNKRWR